MPRHRSSRQAPGPRKLGALARDAAAEATNDPELRRAAVGAALLGVAASAGKLGWDRLGWDRHHAGDGDDRGSDRHFALATDERLDAGLRRIARGRIDAAIEHLTRGHSDDAGPSAHGVHGARKDIKRLRATVRLARDEIGTARAREDNVTLRDAGRRLADARDSAVLLERLAQLRERYGDELQTDDLHGIESTLQIEHERANERLRNDPHTVGLVVRDLETTRGRVAGWKLGRGFAAVAPGLRRIYARGRREHRAAMLEPDLDTLHDWRKRVKDLRHAAELLESRAPRRLRPVARRARKLADVLGEDHDLALLRERALALAPAADGAHSAPEQPPLAAVIDRRRVQLLERAAKLADKLYRRKPRAFVKRVRLEYKTTVKTRAP